jgi:hypothetical protein
MSFDEVSFDEKSFDELSFDELSFDELSFDEMSFGDSAFDEVVFVEVGQSSKGNLWQYHYRRSVGKKNLAKVGFKSYPVTKTNLFCRSCQKNV